MNFVERRDIKIPFDKLHLAKRFINNPSVKYEPMDEDKKIVMKSVPYPVAKKTIGVMNIEIFHNDIWNMIHSGEYDKLASLYTPTEKKEEKISEPIAIAEVIKESPKEEVHEIACEERCVIEEDTIVEEDSTNSEESSEDDSDEEDEDSDEDDEGEPLSVNSGDPNQQPVIRKKSHNHKKKKH